MAKELIEPLTELQKAEGMSCVQWLFVQSLQAVRF